MFAFETFEHAGCTIELHTDDEPTPPSDWDQLGTLVAMPSLWREYRFAERVADSEECDAIERGGFRLLARYLRMTRGEIAVPFDYFEHGPQGTLRMAPMKEQSPSGYIYTTAERVRELCGEAPERQELDLIRASLIAELGDWRSYIEGRVIGFIVYDAEGNNVESCWGFYPDEEGDGYEHVRAEARAAAETHAHDDAVNAEPQDVAEVIGEV